MSIITEGSRVCKDGGERGFARLFTLVSLEIRIIVLAPNLYITLKNLLLLGLHSFLFHIIF